MKIISFFFLSLFLMLFTQNKVMKVKQGEVFKIVLKANHSSGYSWHWDKDAEGSIIDSVYVDYVLSNRTAVGGGGNEIWEFKAKKKGKQKLIMVYKRPWEKNEAVENREILIEVE